MSDQDPTVTPFSAEPTPAVEPAPAPVQDPVPVAPSFQIPEAVKSLVGEGMKYATPEDALQSIPHAQSHIEKLEEELASVREDLIKRKAVEDVLQEINKTPSESVSEPQITQEQLDALIESKLATKESMAIAKANTNEVVSKFVDVYGDKDKAQEVYTQKAADLGIPVDTINNLAATSPKAVYELFGISPTKESAPVKLNSNVNSEAAINNARAPVAPKSVMGQSTHAADIAAWRASAPTE